MARCPAASRTRVSAYAALLAALAPEDRAVEVWAPAAVDAARLCLGPGVPAPVMRTGTPPRSDLAWARADARAVNDRRLAHAVARAMDAALPGARELTAVEALDGVTGRWVCKAPWTSAGRDRCHGEGPPTVEQRTRLGPAARGARRPGVRAMAASACSTSACARRSEPTGRWWRRRPTRSSPTRAATFLGIELAPPPLLDAERVRLTALVDAAGAAIARLGYVGPFAVDAFVYRVGDQRRFHPLCEINARYTFGWVARALGRRLGVTRLGFGAPPPAAPGPDRARGRWRHGVGRVISSRATGATRGHESPGRCSRPPWPW